MKKKKDQRKKNEKEIEIKEIKFSKGRSQREKERK